MANNPNSNPNVNNVPLYDRGSIPNRTSSGSLSVDSILRGLASISGNMEASTKEFRTLVEQYKKMNTSTGVKSTPYTQRSTDSVKSNYTGLFNVKSLQNIRDKELRNRSEVEKITQDFIKVWRDQLGNIQETSKELVTASSPLVGVFKNLEGRMVETNTHYMNKMKAFQELYDKEMNDIISRVDKTQQHYDNVGKQSEEIANKLARYSSNLELNRIEISDKNKKIISLTRAEKELRVKNNNVKADELKQQRDKLVQERELLSRTNKELTQQMSSIEKQKETIDKSLNRIGNELDTATRNMQSRSEEVDNRLGISEGMSNATMEFENTINSLYKIAEMTKESNALGKTADSYITKPNYSQRHEARVKEKAVKNEAFNDAEELLSKLIVELNSTLEQQRKIAERQTQSAEALKQSAENLTNSAQSHIEAAQIARDAGDSVKAQEEEQLAEQDKRNAEIKSNNAKEAENLAKEAENNVVSLETQRDSAINSRESLMYANSTFGKIANTIKGAIGDSLVNGIKKIANTFYDAQLSAFQRVYSAIEDTQNSIASKLRIDSGAYDKFTDSVDSAIAEQGLESVLSSADALEEIRSLVDMGERDQDFISAVGLSQSKAKALGASNVSVTNEETLKQIKSTYNDIIDSGGTTQEASLAIQKFVDDLIGIELGVGETYGSVKSLSNGGFNELINTFLPYMRAAGASTEAMTASLAGAANFTQTLENSGIDSSMIMEDIKTMLENKDYGSLSAQSLTAMQQYGIRTESIQEAAASGDLADIFSSFVANRANIYSDIPVNMLGQVMSVYGDNSSVVDAQLLKEAYNQGKLTNTNNLDSEDFKKSYQEAIKSAQEGDYYSSTYKVTKNMENAAYLLADGAQNIAFGDSLTLAAVNSIKNTVESILDTMLDAGTSALLGTGGSMFGGAAGAGAAGMGGAGAGAAGLKTFMTGGAGAAGVAGKALGIAGGGVLMGVSVVNAITDEENTTSGQVAEDIFTDPTFYGGFGATLGSIVAGPLGAIVGGVVLGGASMLGNWLSDKIVKVDDEIGAFSDHFDKISQAAQDLSDAAKETRESAEVEKKSLEDMNIFQKRQYLMTENNLTAEELNNMTEQEVNQKFNDAVDVWYNGELARAEADQKKSDFILNNADKFAILEDFADDEDYKDNKEALDTHAKASGAPLAALEYANTASVGGKKMSAAQAVTDLFEGVELSDNAKNAYIRTTEELMNNQEAWEESNSTFQKRWSDAVTNAGPNADINQIIAVYAESNNGVTPAIESDPNSSMAKGVDAHGIPVDKNNLPFLTTANGKFIPEHYQGKFKTGIDYIPEDNYLALLHEGEMVLNKPEATHYRNDNYVSEKDLLTYSNSVITNEFMDNLTEDSVLDVDVDNNNLQKFKTGIDYIPEDNYEALLHEGEMVLNKPEANQYRNDNSLSTNELLKLNNELTDVITTSNENLLNNSELIQSIINNHSNETSYTFDSDPIVNSIGSQTNKIESLLTTIISLLSQNNKIGVSSRGFQSVIGLDSNVGRLNAL